MQSLFDGMVNEGRNRPVVAVISVDSDKNYNMKFDYASVRALEIALLKLGTPESYFGSEVDIPPEVIEMQNE